MPLSKLSILLFIGEEELKNQLFLLLKEKCGQLHLASTPKQAADLVERHTPDLVLCDRLEEEEVYQFLTALREKRDHLPVIAFYTAGLPQEKMARASNLGKVLLTAAPPHSDELAAVLQRALKLLSQKHLQALSARLERIFDGLDAMVMVTDGAEILAVNKAFLAFFDVGKLGEFKAVHPDFSRLFVPKQGYVTSDGPLWLKAVAERPMGHRKILLKNAREELKSFTVHFSPFPGAPDRYVVDLTDITHEEEFYQGQLRECKTTDSPKMRAWKVLGEQLDREVHRCERYGAKLSVIAVCLVDANNKRDSLDRRDDKSFSVLEKLVLGLIRTTDFFGKWEANRYMVLLAETHTEGATKFIQRLDNALKSNFYLRDQGYKLKCGTAFYRSGDSSGKLFKRAVNGMEKACKVPGVEVVTDES